MVLLFTEKTNSLQCVLVNNYKASSTCGVTMATDWRALLWTSTRLDRGPQGELCRGVPQAV